MALFYSTTIMVLLIIRLSKWGVVWYSKDNVSLLSNCMTMRRYVWAVSVALGVLVVAKGVVPVLNAPGFSSATVLQGLFRSQNSDTLQWSLKCSSESSTVAETGCDKAMPNVTGEWVSDGQKAGASIEVQFPIEVELTGVHIFDRGDARETIQDGHIEFFDGTRYPVVGGIAVLANPTFPNAVVTFPTPLKTVGFRFVVDSVSSSTTSVGLAEIAPVFEIAKDARIRPRRLVGKVGTSVNDVDGVLPLIPLNASSQTSLINNNSSESIIAVDEDNGSFSIAAVEKRPSDLLMPPSPGPMLRFDLSNDFYQGSSPWYPFASFHVTEALFYIEDSFGNRISLGPATDITNINQGPGNDGWTPVSFDVGSVVKQTGTYRVYWRWNKGWDSSHVKNLRIEYNGQSYWDRDRGTELKDAFDGLGDAADGGQYVDHYVVVDSPTILPPPPAVPARLEVTIPASSPAAQQFTAGMKNTVWAQYKFTAVDGDIAIQSIPIALAINQKIASVAGSSQLGYIRLYASSDASMANKIQIGAPQGVRLGSTGNATVQFDKYPFTLTRGQSIFVTIETDIVGTIISPQIASLGVADGMGGASLWATVGGEPTIGWYSIVAEATETKKRIDQKTINSTSSIGGTIAAGADHQLVGASVQVRESSTPALPAFAGGIIDEPVFQFALESQAGTIGIKRIEFIGSGTCNGDMQDRGNAKLFDITKSPDKLIAQWTNQPLNDLVYSTFDHEPIAVAVNNTRSFQLRVTTNCANGQALQYAIGGTHAFSGARATVSGIQWFIPSLGASQAIDSPMTRGVPLSGALLSARGSDPLVDDTLTEVPTANILMCLQTEEDRSSYPFQIMRVALLPQNPPGVGEEFMLNIRLKNRFDVAQLYTITVNWGDGFTDVYNAPRVLKGQALQETVLTHTYARTTSAGFPIQVRVHNNDRVASSSLLSCTVVPTGGDPFNPPPPPPPPTDNPRSSTLIIMPGVHTSVGVIFDGLQEIGLMTLAMTGENLASNTIKIWSAGSDQRYTTVLSEKYTTTITATGLSVKLKNPLSAQYVKIQVVVDNANTNGVAISNPINDIEIYSPYGP